MEVAGVTEDTDRESLDATVSSIVPNIVVIGAKSVGPATVDKMKTIRATKPEAVIVLLADHYDPEGIEALRGFSREAPAGYPYLSSDILEKRDKFTDTIAMAAAGRIIVDRAVMAELLDPVDTEPTLFASLEPWERDVLKLMVDGFPDEITTEET